MTATTKKTLAAATEAMIRAEKPWLSPADAPALAMLRSLAALIDAEPTAALHNSYGVAYRALIARAPQAAPAKSPLGAALEEAMAHGS
ncbi:hypothetical protein E5344_12230 [Microbacterium laevaniformans]|uniref:Uncharacterized protein n=1 Tax=Microbacterium laevaniformans TaxID=36807 RepID=A0A4S2D1S2_9MICO|nr:hypothetical protein [Microbacterium laevaniformans]TGY35046.1 hypothetical protein E5344_12230 [Microbacterium laevaniformans]